MLVVGQQRLELESRNTLDKHLGPHVAKDPSRRQKQTECFHNIELKVHLYLVSNQQGRDYCDVQQVQNLNPIEYLSAARVDFEIKPFPALYKLGLQVLFLLHLHFLELLLVVLPRNHLQNEVSMTPLLKCLLILSIKYREHLSLLAIKVHFVKNYKVIGLQHQFLIVQIVII